MGIIGGEGGTRGAVRRWNLARGGQTAGDGSMSTPEERKIVEDLDREVSQSGGLVALVLCLLVGGALLVVMAMDVLGPG